MMRLNLGCQIHYFDSWVNIDIVGDDPNVRVDLACDVSSLPYGDNSVDFIYAGHLVEHFYPDTLPVALKEWHRVLRPGGKLVVVTPDCGTVMRDYTRGKFGIQGVWQQIYGRIYAYDRDSERHHIAFDAPELIRFFTEFPHFQWMDFNNPPVELAPFMDVHISRGAYQLGVVLTK